MDEEDESDFRFIIIEDIQKEFEYFKNQHKPLDNTDIEITRSDEPSQIVFFIYNGVNQCMVGYISLQSNKELHISEITHCGGNNISLLLTFLKTISVEYKAPITIEDASRFEFQNVKTKKETSIELKKLYTLSEGRTYYDKYLNPTKTPIWYNTPIMFFEENRDKFTYSEYDKIILILSDGGINTIGGFFMKIRELLKSISRNGDGVKLVGNENWENLLLYKDIIDKTYNIFKTPKGGKLKKTKRKSRKRKSGKQKN